MLRLKFRDCDSTDFIPELHAGSNSMCKHLIPGKPLYVDQLTDKNGVLKSAMYVVGERGGITFFSGN